MSEDRLIFVYGSLKRNEYNHPLIAGLELIGEGQVRDIGLFTVHDRYPYASPLRGARVRGEVYRVPADLARRMDAFEASDGYSPEPVWVKLTTGQIIVAEIYIVPPERLAALGAQRHPGSTWHGPALDPDPEAEGPAGGR